MKSTLIIGASENIDRYSNKAAKALQNKQINVFLIGNKPGKINDLVINTGFPLIENIHTVSIYINAKHQETYFDYILKLQPKRVIFNPGTENPIFFNKITEQNIIAENACTLVLLNLNTY